MDEDNIDERLAADVRRLVDIYWFGGDVEMATNLLFENVEVYADVRSACMLADLLVRSSIQRPHDRIVVMSLACLLNYRNDRNLAYWLYLVFKGMLTRGEKDVEPLLACCVELVRTGTMTPKTRGVLIRWINRSFDESRRRRSESDRVAWV